MRQKNNKIWFYLAAVLLVGLVFWGVSREVPFAQEKTEVQLENPFR